MAWDQDETKILVDLGLSWEHARIAVGRMAEHRQYADRDGYIRGYQNGWESRIEWVSQHDRDLTETQDLL